MPTTIHVLKTADFWKHQSNSFSLFDESSGHIYFRLSYEGQEVTISVKNEDSKTNYEIFTILNREVFSNGAKIVRKEIGVNEENSEALRASGFQLSIDKSGVISAYTCGKLLDFLKKSLRIFSEEPQLSDSVTFYLNPQAYMEIFKELNGEDRPVHEGFQLSRNFLTKIRQNSDNWHIEAGSRLHTSAYVEGAKATIYCGLAEWIFKNQKGVKELQRACGEIPLASDWRQEAMRYMAWYERRESKSNYEDVEEVEAIRLVTLASSYSYGDIDINIAQKKSMNLLAGIEGSIVSSNLNSLITTGSPLPPASILHVSVLLDQMKHMQVQMAQLQQRVVRLEEENQLLRQQRESQQSDSLSSTSSSFPSNTLSTNAPLSSTALSSPRIEGPSPTMMMSPRGTAVANAQDLLRVDSGVTNRDLNFASINSQATVDCSEQSASCYRSTQGGCN